MGFFHDGKRVRLRSREYGAYARADDGGVIFLHRDHGTLYEARAAHGGLIHGIVDDRHLVQIIDGESPVGDETNHAVKCTIPAGEKDGIAFEAFRAEEQRERQATQAPALAAKEPAPTMEFFPDQKHVWIRILECGEDGEAIACCRNRGTTRPRQRAWAAHRLVRDDTDYFAQTEDESYIPVQRTYDSPEQDSVLFQAFRAEDGADDIFNLAFGDWCHPDDMDTPMRWLVEAKPPRMLYPEPRHPRHPTPPPAVPFCGPICLRRRGVHAIQPQAVLRRRINYVEADDQGNFSLQQWTVLEQWFELNNDEQLTDPSDEQFMDMVLSNETDDCILPSMMALHGLPSRITAEEIGNMRVFLMCVGDQNFLNVFNGCLEPIVDQVQQQNSYAEFLGNPMKQTVSSTCAIVASAKCIEVQHRREYETYYRAGTFPCEAASPWKLRSLCRREKIWTVSGAYAGDVLDLIKRAGGIKTTNAPTPAPYLLPLDSWEQHRYDDGNGLTADRVMELLDARGPFVGTLWLCPWYSLFDAKEDESLVYRSGCARSKIMQDWSKRYFAQYKVPLGFHSVVCFAYRVIGGELHVLVLDNNTPTGPERWIHYLELEEVHTVRVNKLDPPVRRDLVYPRSIYI